MYYAGCICTCTCRTVDCSNVIMCIIIVRLIFSVYIKVYKFTVSVETLTHSNFNTCIT